MDCSNCGKLIYSSKGKKFCPFCGKEIQETSPSAYLKCTGKFKTPMLWVSGETAKSLMNKFPVGTEFSTTLEYGKKVYIALTPLNLPSKIEEITSTFPRVESLSNDKQKLISNIKSAQDKERDARRDK